MGLTMILFLICVKTNRYILISGRSFILDTPFCPTTCHFLTITIVAADFAPKQHYKTKPKMGFNSFDIDLTKIHKKHLYSIFRCYIQF